MITQNTQHSHSSSFKFYPASYRKAKVLWIGKQQGEAKLTWLKKHGRLHWVKQKKMWYLYDNKKNRKLLQKDVNTESTNLVGKEVLSQITAGNKTEFEKYQNILKLKAYSRNTIRTYSIEFAQLLYLLKDYPVRDLSAKKLQSYFLYCTKNLQLSESQIHSRMNAVKFYFEQVLHRSKMFFDIPRPKKPLKLPKSLNQREVKKIIEVTKNSKHSLILKLCYGMGLRVSEIVKLKIEDIDSQRMKVLIDRGKGKKDRYVNLPQSTLSDLRHYYLKYRPENYLFEGQHGGQYSVRSAQKVFKKSLRKAGIRKSIGIHGLRHSYATHLLEMGTDISFIQKLLGHNNIKTTMAYTQISDRTITDVKSPLDKI